MDQQYMNGKHGQWGMKNRDKMHFKFNGRVEALNALERMPRGICKLHQAKGKYFNNSPD
jgi:hypothetical protein